MGQHGQVRVDPWQKQGQETDVLFPLGGLNMLNSPMGSSSHIDTAASQHRELWWIGLPILPHQRKNSPTILLTATIFQAMLHCSIVGEMTVTGVCVGALTIFLPVQHYVRGIVVGKCGQPVGNSCEKCCWR